MSNIVISAHGISKQYRLGVTNHGQLTKDLQSWWARLRGKDDPGFGSLEAEAFRVPKLAGTVSGR